MSKIAAKLVRTKLVKALTALNLAFAPSEAARACATVAGGAPAPLLGGAMHMHGFPGSAHMRVLAVLTLGLLAAAAYADDLEYGSKVVVTGSSYVCRSHNELRLLWSAIATNDLPAYRARMTSGSCGFVAEKEQLTDCEFRGQVSTTASAARCVTVVKGKQSLQDLYLSHGSLVPKYRPKKDMNFSARFDSDLAKVRAEQDRLRAALAEKDKKIAELSRQRAPGK